MMASTKTPQTNRTTPIFIFDNPRTSSQLLHQYFSAHPQLDATPGMISSWIWPMSVAGPDRLVSKLKISGEAKEADAVLDEEIKKWYKDKVNVDVDQMFKVEYMQMGFEANAGRVLGDGKNPFSREHRTSIIKQDLLLELLRTGKIAKPPANPTYIPNSLYYSLHNPIILIRHPARVIPSYWRSQRIKQKYSIDDEPMRAWTMQSTAKFLYDLFEKQGKEPSVVDGDDVMFRGREVCKSLCGLWGLDEEGVRFEWEEADDLSKSFPLSGSYMGRIFHSKGVEGRDWKGVNIDEEEKKWEDEFGSEVAGKMREIVDGDMTDYEYLKAKKLSL